MHDIGNRMGFKVNQIGPVHPTVEGGYQAALALEGGDTTAIIAYNDLIAVGIVLRFTADGVNVPGDVSVIGFDNTLIAPVVTSHVANKDYADALKVLASVRAEVDQFFEDVMVNVDEPLIRANRLGLLKALFDQLNAVADISKLGV